MSDKRIVIIALIILILGAAALHVSRSASGISKTAENTSAVNTSMNDTNRTAENVVSIPLRKPPFVKDQ